MSGLEPTVKDFSNLSELSFAMGVAKKKTDQDCGPLKLAYFPYSTSQQTYNKIVRISQVWQKLVFEAAKDDQLILRVYDQIKQTDPMVSNLMRIKKLISNNRETFSFLRNDYFIDQQGLPKIIEYNLTAVSMAAHSQNFQQAKRLSDFKNRSKYVKNEPMNILAAQIYEFYVRNNLSGLFVMVVSAGETNFIQQRQIEIRLLQKGIRVLRITFSQAASLKMDSLNNLFYQQELVSVVYYRTGYQISDYQENPKLLWQTRQTIQISNAIKIPSVNYDLINQKRMQVQLSKQSVYSKFLSEEDASLLRQSLVPVWQFDHMNEEQVKDLIQKLKSGGKEYILKPNLQGGGHNIYGIQAIERLQTMNAEQRKKYILMQKINTKPIQNILVCCNKYMRANCMYQVSQYGIITTQKGELYKSETCGFLIRVKPQHENEGGIMAGVGSICSWIIDQP